jgi:NAD(P)-dependent dehydrogenase (short-subunit alcohol dehydrogenase family)
MAEIRPRTVVITGASSGIGLETARALAGQGCRVVMVVRSKDRGEAAIASIRKTVPGAALELVLADLYSLAEVRKAGAELRAKVEHLDVLINNAGLIHDARELTVDGVERTFALNHLAAFLLTYELRELLAASAPARVITVASAGHRYAKFTWDDLATMKTWTGQVGVYGASKLCNIWFAREAAVRFKGKGVTSNSLHPGAVASNFGASGGTLFRIGVRIARPFLLTSAQGARTSVHLATSREIEGITGEYWAGCKLRTPTALARDDAQARRLWELSETLCGVTWS